MSTIPALPYFVLKSGEHDITVTLFTDDLSKPWKIPLVRKREIDDGRVCKCWWRYFLPFFFLAIEKWGKVEGGGAFRYASHQVDILKFQVDILKKTAIFAVLNI